MTGRNSTMSQTYRLTAYGLMTALAFVGNYIRFPFLGSQIAVSNALCVLCGLILGPWAGFVTAGIGNLLYDLIAGYGVEGLITLVSKGAIGLIAGAIGFGAMRKSKLEKKDYARLVLAAAAGAVTYVALYMLKTYVMGVTVKGLTTEGAITSMGLKLPASAINAVFATVAAPVLAAAVQAPLHRMGVGK